MSNSLFFSFFLLHLHTTVIIHSMHSAMHLVYVYHACLPMISDMPVCRHVNVATTVSLGYNTATLALNQLLWLGCTYIVSLRYAKLYIVSWTRAVIEYCWQIQ